MNKSKQNAFDDLEKLQGELANLTWGSEITPQTDWQKKAYQLQAKNDDLEKKINIFKNGIIEERQLHERELEEMEYKSNENQKRADALEEKLLKLIEIVKADRAKQQQQSPNNAKPGPTQNNQAMEELKKKLADAEELCSTLNDQVISFESAFQEAKAKLSGKEKELEKANSDLNLAKGFASKVEELKKQLEEKEKLIESAKKSIQEEKKRKKTKHVNVK